MYRSDFRIRCASGLVLSIILTLYLTQLAQAETAHSLEEQGWREVYRGTVSDTFNGCDFDVPVPIDGGYIFMCEEYNYHYAYRPAFKVFKLGSTLKYSIDGEIFSGGLFKGTPIHTYVAGEFDGCEFGKMILFENGLKFECHVFRYHYAFHPKVIIVGRYVTIDGEKYAGQLYKGR
jgi:hypothetical protein